MRKAIEIFKQQPIEFQQREIGNYFNLTELVIKEQSMYIRETIFEEVRKQYFPQLPSRKTCIWVLKAEAIDYWCKALNVQNYKILELKLTGSMHRADQKHLSNDTFGHDTFRSNAFQYWTGTDGLNTIKEEILFEGVIDIIQEFNSIPEFKAYSN